MKMKKVFYWGSMLMALAATPVLAEEPANVLIDPGDPYITTIASLSKAQPESALQRMKEAYSQRAGARIVSWQDFKQSPEKYILPNIRRNDYPEVDIVAGLAKLLEKYEGTPFGLTWNGGLGVTHSDYAYAARTFKAFSDDKADTVPARDPDRRADPVHPLNHLEPLLAN